MPPTVSARDPRRSDSLPLTGAKQPIMIGITVRRSPASRAESR